MEITEDKVKVYELLSNLFWKCVFSFVMVIAFIVVLIYLLNTKDWKIAVPLALLEMFLGGTLFPVVKHYFPTKDDKK